jgi:hypothetical protein
VDAFVIGSAAPEGAAPLTQVRGFHLENGLAALKDGLYTGGRRYGVVMVAIASGGDGSIIRRG